MADPFSLVYDALFDLAFAHPGLNEMVKAKNRASYTSETNRTDPVKDKILTDDVPEIVLLSLGVTSGNLHATSSTSKVTRRYAFHITTGDFRLNKFVLPIEWALCCALVDWKETLTTLKWPVESDWSYVKHCQIADISEGFADAEKNRGIRGWSAVWACDLEMHFKTADLKAEME